MHSITVTSHTALRLQICQYRFIKDLHNNDLPCAQKGIKNFKCTWWHSSANLTFDLRVQHKGHLAVSFREGLRRGWAADWGPELGTSTLLFTCQRDERNRQEGPSLGPQGRCLCRNRVVPLATYNFRTVGRGHGWIGPLGGGLGAVADGRGGLGPVVQVHGGVGRDSAHLAGAVAQDVLLVPVGGGARQVTGSQIHRVRLKRVLWPRLLGDDVVTHRVGRWAGGAGGGDPGRGSQLTSDLTLDWGCRQRNIHSSKGQQENALGNHILVEYPQIHC